MDAEQLGHLVEQDHQADPGLEPGQHRRRDEVRDEAELEHRGQDQDRADQGGQRGEGGQEPSRVAVGHREGELGAGQDGDRRGRGHVEHPRGAERGVDQQRQEAGVEADLDRETGDRRQRHRLGQHDGRGGQAGDDVDAERRGPTAGRGGACDG